MSSVWYLLSVDSAEQLKLPELYIVSKYIYVFQYNFILFWKIITWQR